jgi:hypothetical protein
MGNKVNLGDKVRDTVTGFAGVATSRTEYLTGGPRIQVEAMVDNKPTSEWFDEARLTVEAA